MKLLTFDKQGVYQLGVQTEQGIIDLAASIKKNANLNNLPDYTSLMTCNKEQIAKLQHFIETIVAQESAVFVEEEQITWGPCVTKPHKIICVGLNYRKHADETNAPYPEVPILFNKFDNTLTGHNSEIAIPNVTKELDYEVELAVIIGKGGKNITKETAMVHVYGYTIINDISARDCRRAGQWIVSKGQDTFAPMGPVLVTRDEISDPQNLNLKLSVNGVEKQSSNTKFMLFNINDLVHDLSTVFTLDTGDIIATGTPSGVGAGRNPQEFMWPGDVVEATVEGIGTLRNTIVDSDEV